jgi:Cu-processing system permease protein
MIGRIYAIALNTFREAIRHRILYGILAVVFGLNMFTIVLGEMSLHEQARLARDIGLAGISLFGATTAIYLGVSLLYGEIYRKTIYTIISKPIERFEFVLGKYAGMACTLSLLVILFAAAMVVLLLAQQVPLSAALAKALILTWLEVLVVAALAIFFSSFSTPFLSGIFTFAVFFIGRATPELRAAVETAQSAVIRGVCRATLQIVPDLHLFAASGSTVDGQHVSVHGEFVRWSYVGTAAGYGVLVIVMLLTCAIVIFSRRNFV